MELEDSNSKDSWAEFLNDHMKSTSTCITTETNNLHSTESVMLESEQSSTPRKRNLKSHSNKRKVTATITTRSNKKNNNFLSMDVETPNKTEEKHEINEDSNSKDSWAEFLNEHMKQSPSYQQTGPNNLYSTESGMLETEQLNTPLRRNLKSRSNKRKVTATTTKSNMKNNNLLSMDVETPNKTEEKHEIKEDSNSNDSWAEYLNEHMKKNSSCINREADNLHSTESMLLASEPCKRKRNLKSYSDKKKLPATTTMSNKKNNNLLSMDVETTNKTEEKHEIQDEEDTNSKNSWMKFDEDIKSISNCFNLKPNNTQSAETFIPDCEQPSTSRLDKSETVVGKTKVTSAKKMKNNLKLLLEEASNTELQNRTEKKNNNNDGQASLRELQEFSNNCQPSTSKAALRKTKKRIPISESKRIIYDTSLSPKVITRSLRSKSNRSETAHVPPRTRNYARMTSRELNILSERVRIFHESGTVVSEEEAEVKLCKNKNAGPKKRRNLKELGPQVPGTHLGKGNVGVGCSKYGISRCLCCNVIPQKVIQEESDLLKTVNLQSTSCSIFGIYDCACCLKSKNSQDDDTIDLEVLSISQILPAEIDQDGCSSNDTTSKCIEAPCLPTSTLSKQKLIEKFFDSFTPDRVDYTKPEQKNIVEGLVQNPVSYYSEHLCENMDVPERTIVERIDFQKEQERLARLSMLLNLPSTSKQNLELNSFPYVGFDATSTPQSAMKPPQLSPIEGDLSTTSPERPTENLKPVNNCDFGYEQASTSSVVVNTNQGCTVKNEPDFDISQIDQSFVTLRTPLKPRNYASSENMDLNEEEAAIMEYVTSLIASEEANIIQECEMRSRRMLETQQNTHQALTSGLDAIEILDDDMPDTSVQIIDTPIECLSDTSVETIDDGQNSDIEIIEYGSTVHFQHCYTNRKKNKMLKPEPVEVSSSDLIISPTEKPDNKTCRECSICLESLHKVKEISATVCGHIFCTVCIKGAIKSNKKCPICRAALTLKKIHPLFLF